MGSAAGAGKPAIIYVTELGGHFQRAITIAHCPAGTTVVSGGVKTIPNSLDSEVSVTAPLGNGWRGEANGGSAKHRGIIAMTTIAVCARTGRYRVVSKSRAIPPGTQVERTVSCPGHTKVVGGGVFTSNTDVRIEVAATEPFDGRDRNSEPDDGWVGDANNGTDSTESMTVYAVCASSGRYEYLHSSRLELADNSAGALQVPCPQGTAVVGGGLDVTGIDPGVEVADTFPIDGPDPGRTPDTWFGQANNDNSGSTQSMTVFAICKH